MSGFLGTLIGSSTLLVGVEEHDPTGGVKAYLGHRGRGLYALVTDPDAASEIRRAWNCSRRHIIVPTPPPHALFSDEEDEMAVGHA